MLHRLVALALTFLSLALTAAEPPADLRDAEAWYRAARAEAERIPDPEQRHLIGQLASASQKVTEEEADKQVDALRGKYRGRPGIQAWEVSREAGRHYETLGHYRRAAEALDQAAREVDGLAAEKAEVLRELDDARQSLVARAADHHLPLAEEIADKIVDAQTRESAIKTVASHWIEFDLATVERLLRKIDEERRNQALRLVLLQRTRNDKNPHLKRGVDLFLQDAATMSEADLRQCFIRLQHIAPEVAATCDAEQISRLVALLEQTPRESKQYFNALSCLVALRIAQGRFDDALKLADSGDDPSRQNLGLRRQISLALIKAGRPEEAERAAGAMDWQLAEAYIRAKKPREALAAARRTDDIRTAYPHVVAALAMLPPEERDTAEQALQDLAYDDVRVHALADWAEKVFDQQQPERARELVARAEKQLTDIKDSVQQRSAGLAVGRAYAHLGENEKAEALLQKHGTKIHFLQAWLKSAEQRLKAKDQAGFERDMTQVLLVLRGKELLSFGENSANEEFSPVLWQRPRPRRPERAQPFGPGPYGRPGNVIGTAFGDVAPAPAAPVADVAPPKRERLTHDEHADAVARFYHFLQASRLYRQAGDAKQARQLGSEGIAAYSKVGGSFERWEMFGEAFLDAKTPERLQELAELSQDAKNSADRAVLLTLGGALAKHLRDEGK